ncbi:hypothetical protein LCGC14_1508980 [marine sediment metagenome]|uniref:Uncharacterized protein n=1 Tax=marine sediment metagenome TaxID=412755 RepID=A0A0F9M349_9ZZZZ
MPGYVYGMIAGTVCILIGMLIGWILRRNSKQQPGVDSPPAPDVVSPEVIKDITERAIKTHEMGKTTEEIIDEMNNLPKYKP